MNEVKKVSTEEVVGILNRMRDGENVTFGIEHAVALIKVGAYLSDAPLPLKLQEANGVADQLSAISELFTERKHANEKALKEAINDIFTNLQNDALDYVLHAFRGIALDGAFITDEGYRCDANQEVVENPDFSLKSGKAVAPWGTIEYFNIKTGTRITSDAYKALSQKDQDDYEIRRKLSINDDGFSQDIDQCKTLWVSIGITKDIEEHPSMADRYIFETRAGYQRHPESGMMYEYRLVIAKAVAKLGKLEYAEGKILSESIARGIVKSWWHIRIATLVTLHCECKEADFRKISDEDINRYLDLVELFATPDKVPEDELELYRDHEGQLLTGMDEDGNQIKNNTVTTDQQRKSLTFMAEKLLVCLHKNFGSRDDVRTNPVIKRLGKLYFELICNR